MANLTFTYVPEQDFSRGIDQYSAEAQIQPGFVEDALNVDIKERRLVKRPGYQAFAGGVPMRVESLEYEVPSVTYPNGRVYIQLNNALDLSVIRDVPIVVYGRTSLDAATYGGDLDTVDLGHYYYVINTDPRKILSGATTLVDDHGFTHTNFLVGVVESLSPLNYDNSVVKMDKYRIDKSSYDLTLHHTLTNPLSSFVYYRNVDTISGQNYIDTTAPLTAGTHTHTIISGSHGLNNYNILATIFEDTGTEWEEVKVDQVKVYANGNVDVTYTLDVSVTDIKIILTSLPTQNIKEATFSGTGLQTFTLSGQTNPFIFYALYAKDGADLIGVEPQSIAYDTALQQYTITVDVGTSTSFIMYYDFGQIQTNVLTVEPDSAVLLTGNDPNPQMVLWGIPHGFSGVYGTSKLAREGWVTHLDSYRSSSDKHIVCGLGGNLFAALPRTQLSSQYKLPELLINLRNRVDVDTLIGPLFRGTGETFARSRGYVNFTGGTSGWATVTEIAYQTSGPNVGQVRYTLNVPSYSASPSLVGAFSTTSNLEDWLTVQQTGYAVHAGEFRIRAVSGVDANNIYVYVENTAIDTADYNETDVGGLAGVFTDQLALDTENYFIPEDKLLADIFTDAFDFTVKSSTTTIVVFTGAVDTLSIPTGLRVRGQRTSSIIPLRTNLDIASVEDFVIGDVFSYPYTDRLMSIHSVIAKDDVPVTIIGDGEEATITLGSGDTNFLPVGQKFTLVHAGPYTGVHEVKDVLNLSELVISHTSTETVSYGEIQGKSIHVDDNFTWYDDSADITTLTVDRRWVPIEAPDDNYAVTPNYRNYHFDRNDYTDQPFLRSVMVSDNLYLTNGHDEVLKYDGTSLYRAGLFRWQPSLFLSVRSGGNITVPSLSIAGTASGSTFSVTTGGEEESLNEGDRINIGGDKYTIIRINTTTNDVIVDRTISSGTSIELASSTYRYYYRLNAIDANNNIVASAVTGQEDARVELTGSSDIQHKLVGFPTWDNYDYDRIELEIYRTKRSTQAPFYKVVTLPVDFDLNGGYLTYLDTARDEVLSQLDPVNSALLGSEIGTGWEEPMRAKYLTTANNSLVLANIKDYPQLDLVIDGSTATVANCSGLKWSLERDLNVIAPTVTDNSGTLIFETLVPGGASEYACTVDGVTTAQFDVNFTAAAPLVAGDWIYVFHKGSVSNPGLDPCGWWQVNSVPSANKYRIIHPSSGSFSGTQPLRVITATNPVNVPVYINTATAANWDSNYLSNGQPISGPDEKNIVMNRLANAINCVQTKLSRTLGFTPWVVANSDGSYGSGQLILRQPRADTNPFYIRAPNTSLFQIYANGLRVAANAHIQASERVYPSRVLVSYPNYPEMFDYPTAILPQDSDSVLDVNPADGQEITGVIPFFGDSAFGGATKSGVVVCFKQQSIYLLDLGAKARGDNTNTLQKLESQGLGCTAPYSIAVTKDGILFANEAGIYRLNRDLSVEYIGKYMERQWAERTLRDSDSLALMQGHHYAIGKSYKLSVPTNPEEDQPDQVYVYHHSSETGQNGQGGWTRYDSHNAIGWCNLESDAYFCDTAGRVNSIRRVGDETDFRDTDQPIQAVITCRGMDFGAPGIRKVFGAIMTHYRANLAQIDGTVLTYAYDLQEEFRVTDPLRIERVSELTGVSDGVNSKGKTIKSVLDRKRAVYFQVRFTNGNIDEPMDIAGFTVKVAGLTDGGVLEAAKTTR